MIIVSASSRARINHVLLRLTVHDAFGVSHGRLFRVFESHIGGKRAEVFFPTAGDGGSEHSESTILFTVLNLSRRRFNSNSGLLRRSTRRARCHSRLMIFHIPRRDV